MILLYCTEKTHITKNIFSSGHWQTFNYEKLPYAKNSKQKTEKILIECCCLKHCGIVWAI